MAKYFPHRGRSTARTFSADGARRVGRTAAIETLEARQLFSGPTAVDDPAIPGSSSSRAPYSVVHGQTLTIDASNGVLNNDTDSFGLPLSASLEASPAHGSVTLNSDGSFVYTPSSGTYIGTDTFTYTASDGSLTSSPATVFIDVTDQAPVAQSQTSTGDPFVAESTSSAPTSVGGTLSGDSDADGDSITYIPVNATGSPLTPDGSGYVSTAHGKVQLNSDGSYTYAPSDGFIGNDRFYYEVSDGILTSNIASFTIQVTATQPLLANDFNALNYDPSAPPDSTPFLATNVASNDTNASNAPITASGVPSGVTLGETGGTWNGDVYVPADGSAAGTFTYASTAPEAANAPAATITLAQVVPGQTVDVNSSSIFSWSSVPSQSYNATSGQTLTVAADSGLLREWNTSLGDATAAVSAGPNHGTLDISSNGSFTYTPSAGFSGWDYFTFTSSASGKTSPPIAIAIDVSDTFATAYVANGGVTSISAGSTATFDLVGPFADSNHPVSFLTAIIPSGLGPQHGSLSEQTDGSWVYTPTAGYTGSDSFTYKVSDGGTLGEYGGSSQTDVLDSNYVSAFINVV